MDFLPRDGRNILRGNSAIGGTIQLGGIAQGAMPGNGVDSILNSLRSMAVTDPSVQANQAGTDIQAQIDAQNQARTRLQGEMGLAPTGMNSEDMIQAAALKAGAANRARIGAEDQNFKRLAIVQGMDKGNTLEGLGGRATNNVPIVTRNRVSGFTKLMGGSGRRVGINGGRF